MVSAELSSNAASNLSERSTKTFLRNPAVVIVIGILLPVVCIILDPIVFRSGDFGAAILGAYRVAGYGLISLSAIALTLWLSLKRLPSLFSGILSAGCFVAFGIGLAIFPMSLIGLFLGIGVLGFIPFLTALVYWQVAVQTREAAGSNYRASIATLGFLALLATPISLQFYVSNVMAVSITSLADGTEQDVEDAINQLTKLGPLVDTDKLVWSYLNSHSSIEKERLSDAYNELTGDDIEENAWRLID